MKHEQGGFKLTGSANSCMCPSLPTGPMGCRFGREVAAKVERLVGNDCPTTERQMKEKQWHHWSAAHQTTAEISSKHSHVNRRTSSQGFLLPSYTSRGKEGGMGTTPKGFKTQLSPFRFIHSLRTVFKKISNPLGIKQHKSGFHFLISAISPKGNPESLIAPQEPRMGTEV